MRKQRPSSDHIAVIPAVRHFLPGSTNRSSISLVPKALAWHFPVRCAGDKEKVLQRLQTYYIISN